MVDFKTVALNGTLKLLSCGRVLLQNRTGRELARKTLALDASHCFVSHLVMDQSLIVCPETYEPTQSLFALYCHLLQLVPFLRHSLANYFIPDISHAQLVSESLFLSL